MLKSQTISLRMSEIRESLNSQVEDAPVEDREKLLNEYRDSERRYRAELSIEGLADAKPLHPERRELRAKVSVTDYLKEAVSGHAVAGAAAELRQETMKGADEPGRLPFEALLPLEEPEERADAATPTPSTVTTTQQSILARVFARSATMYLGVDMASVATGDADYPVLSTGVSPEMKVAGAAKDAEEATFVVSTIQPTRLTARYLLRIEDLSRFAFMEESLRRDLRDALADAMDLQVLAGNGTAPNVAGFVGASPSLTAPSDPGASDALTFTQVIKAGLSVVDGRYAHTLGESRLLVSPSAYKEAGVAFQTAGTSDVAASDYMIARSGGFRASANLPATASHISKAVAFATGGAGSAVAPVWNGIQLIRDLYSGASSGEVSLTAIALFGFKVLRTAPYSYQKFYLA